MSLSLHGDAEVWRRSMEEVYCLWKEILCQNCFHSWCANCKYGEDQMKKDFVRTTPQMESKVDLNNFVVICLLKLYSQNSEKVQGPLRVYSLLRFR